MLRIEDTDRERSSDEMTRAIVDGMTWLGLDWDEGPVHQADGFPRHRADALRLVQEGHAYRCFCTPEHLQSNRDEAAARGEAYRYDRSCANLSPGESDSRAADEAFTVRFRVPEGTTEWDDLVHGPTRWPNAEMDDFIVLRSDGTPIYNLAVVSDDAEMKITHVIRGDDHIANTPRQILLYGALGAATPQFGHLPMILGPDGKRLSKRHGATAVGEYAERGILPEALVNFLALLGWNPGNDLEIMGLPELVERFSLERVNKKSAVFDTTKLEWMNRQYLSSVPAERLVPLVMPRLAEQGIELAPGRLEQVIELLKSRAETVLDLVQLAPIYLAPEIEYDSAAVAKHWKNPGEARERLAVVHSALADVDAWEPEQIDAALRETAARLDLGFGKVVHPLRLALTGGAASPGIDAVVATMGRETTLRRLETADRWLNEKIVDTAGVET